MCHWFGNKSRYCTIVMWSESEPNPSNCHSYCTLSILVLNYVHDIRDASPNDNHDAVQSHWVSDVLRLVRPHIGAMRTNTSASFALFDNTSAWRICRMRLPPRPWRPPHRMTVADRVQRAAKRLKWLGSMSVEDVFREGLMYGRNTAQKKHIHDFFLLDLLIENIYICPNSVYTFMNSSFGLITIKVEIINRNL